jgi:tetratricopeptide (TPR) repeat protein
VSPDGGVRNELSQSVVGAVLQAGTIHGGVYLHHPVLPRVVPRQLPAAPRFFTDRASELAGLDAGLVTPSEDVGREGPMVVVLTGSGGVGKTALALRWLHHQASRFADGQLFADLSAFGVTGPAAPGEVLARFLRSLGVPGSSIPQDLDERAALFRSETADRAMALLLDDVRSSDQVRPLLPTSSTSVVVVTSRWRLAGLVLSGARLVSVEPLDTDSAVLLLDRAAGQDRVAEDPAAARNVASLCGGVPLALRVVAARLATRPRLRLAGVAHELADRTRRLRALAVDEERSATVSVAASFDMSYRALPADVARAYRLLALHPGGEFSGGVVAAAVDVSQAQAEDLLDVLVRANLLTEIADDRYRFHDLLRVHAQQLADTHDPDDARQQAVRAMLSWYLDLAVAADVVATPLRPHLGDRYRQWETTSESAPLRDPLFDDAAQALDALEHELPTLMAAQELAERHRWDDLAWQLGEALWGVFLYRGRYPEWIATCERSARAAARCGDLIAESRALVQLAAAYLRLNQPDVAERWGRQARERARSAGDWRSEATALESLGSAAHAQGRLDEAIELYRRSLGLNEEHGRVRGMTLLSCYLGYALRDRGDDNSAANAFQRSADLAASIGDDHSRAQALVGLGTVYARQGEVGAAIGEMSEALRMLSDTAAPALRAPVLEQVGELSHQSGDLIGARRYWEQALELYTRAGDPTADRVGERLQKLALPSPRPADDAE